MQLDMDHRVELEFSSFFEKISFDEIAFKISGQEAFRYASNSENKKHDGVTGSYQAADVENALSRDIGFLNENDFMALLSPFADSYLEEIAQKAREITKKRFGNTMQIYTPLYLSSECRSSCTYCGFSHENKIRRKTLLEEEILRESDYLYAQGIRHILLLTGEDYHNTPISYLEKAVELIAPKFPSIGLEVYPLKQEQYEGLIRKGMDSLTIYQETYDPVRYSQVHLRGMKKNMIYRLNCPDRGARAGMRRISIGALLGLSDPAAEVYMVGTHAKYLMSRFWKTHVNVSLPRLRPAEGLGKVPRLPDRYYVRFLCALRMYLPDAGIILSTRESADFRNNMSDICITMMSAGSRTDPGGYTLEDTDGQFSIEDLRSISEVSEMLAERGIDPVFVDWSSVLK
ncbi:MAG: 2-iminoacetate synthase ThiH [Spirochaetia bacterium]|nr:2-iminoacetate synthase ThiH [Spirochaetia bacterium]